MKFTKNEDGKLVIDMAGTITLTHNGYAIFAVNTGDVDFDFVLKNLHSVGPLGGKYNQLYAAAKFLFYDNSLLAIKLAKAKIFLKCIFTKG